MKYKFGLIAKDIQNSVTPVVYGAFSEDTGIESSYDIHNVPEDELVKTLEYFRNNMQGFNITMPYKQVALQYMDELDESAVKCGSTNTVLVRDGKLIAYNTDGWGLIRALSYQGITVEGKKIVMLGAGGVAYSIAYNLVVNKAAKVDVVNLFPEQAEALCKSFGETFIPHPLNYDVLKACCTDADLFINASVMGQIGYDEFASFDFLDVMAPGAAVFDVNYSNPNSKLVPAAHEKGMPAFKGRRMTACQGIRAFQIWTGKEPSRAGVEKLIETCEKMDSNQGGKT